MEDCRHFVQVSVAEVVRWKDLRWIGLAWKQMGKEEEVRMQG